MIFNPINEITELHEKLTTTRPQKSKCRQCTCDPCSMWQRYIEIYMAHMKNKFYCFCYVYHIFMWFCNIIYHCCYVLLLWLIFFVCYYCLFQSCTCPQWVVLAFLGAHLGGSLVLNSGAHLWGERGKKILCGGLGEVFPFFPFYSFFFASHSGFLWYTWHCGIYCHLHGILSVPFLAE